MKIRQKKTKQKETVMKTRKELIDYIYTNSKEEFETLYEVFELAKESKKQLRQRVQDINDYFERENLVEEIKYITFTPNNHKNGNKWHINLKQKPPQR